MASCSGMMPQAPGRCYPTQGWLRKRFGCPCLKGPRRVSVPSLSPRRLELNTREEGDDQGSQTVGSDESRLAHGQNHDGTNVK